MKNRIITIVLGIGALLVYITLSVRTCNNNAYDALNWKAKYDTLLMEDRTFLNAGKIPVIEQKPAKFSNAISVKDASAKAFNLKKKDERKIKKVELFTQVNQEFEMKDELLPFDTVAHRPIFNIQPDSVIWPGTRFGKTNQYYHVNGTIQLDGVLIDSMAIYNTIAIRLADKKRNIFHARETVVQAVNSNPYVKNTSIQSMIVKHRPNAWQRWIKPVIFLGAGVVMGREVR